MKILLANTYYLSKDASASPRGLHPYPPLGLLYLAAYLRRDPSWNVEVFDATFASDEGEFITALKTSRPDVVGIQSIVTTRSSAETMIRAASEVPFSA